MKESALAADTPYSHELGKGNFFILLVLTCIKVLIWSAIKVAYFMLAFNGFSHCIELTV